MAEYKGIFTQIYYWPTRQSKTIHPKAFRSNISGTLFSVASLFGVITAPEFNLMSVVRMCKMSRGM